MALLPVWAISASTRSKQVQLNVESIRTLTLIPEASGETPASDTDQLRSDVCTWGEQLPKLPDWCDTALHQINNAQLSDVTTMGLHRKARLHRRQRDR